jgi:hypothetical protein
MLMVTFRTFLFLRVAFALVIIRRLPYQRRLTDRKAHNLSRNETDVTEIIVQDIHTGTVKAEQNYAKASSL